MPYLFMITFIISVFLFAIMCFFSRKHAGYIALFSIHIIINGYLFSWIAQFIFFDKLKLDIKIASLFWNATHYIWFILSIVVYIVFLAKKST